MIPGRRYISEGQLISLNSQRRKRAEHVYCFLFNDLFVIAKRKGLILHFKKMASKKKLTRGGKAGSTIGGPSLGSSATTIVQDKDVEVQFEFIRQIQISTSSKVERLSEAEIAENTDGLILLLSSCFLFPMRPNLING